MKHIYALFLILLATVATARPLNRGLMAVPTPRGMLVSWRMRQSDGRAMRYYLYRGTTLLNYGKPITGCSNFLDTEGDGSPYSLVVRDMRGNEVERQTDVTPWTSDHLVVPTSAPSDLRGTGATYTPNDCGMDDMDGDGEYEIVVKWDPSNSKDPSHSGVTASTYLDCYRLNGTRLWRIDLGQNIRSGAHTTPFVCADLDGDGCAELMVKTAPGTVDGVGDWVLLEGDDPHASYVNAKGHIASGPEYITVFRGTDGKQLHTLPYHTDYAAGLPYWGDHKQNRSDRYLACPARLDGSRTSAIFARGYYAGAFVGAYDFDGSHLSLRWLQRSTESGSGLWGEGAHNIISADVDDDGCDEIIFGSAALDHDGSLLYRTGMGHGDASHVSDIDLDNPGLEVFMVHEKRPYGYDLRDARTGRILLRDTSDHDTGRGLMADLDARHRGGELMSASHPMMHSAHGEPIAPWRVGSVTSSGLNARIYWDGDLLDEYMDRAHIDKWDSDTHTFTRLATLSDNGSKTINGTKANANLQADMLGDWREEVVHYDSATCHLIITATTHPSPFPVPCLMDNHHYALAIGWQNCCYNQPPHLDHNLIERYTITAQCTQPDTRDTTMAWTTVAVPYPCTLTMDKGCHAYAVQHKKRSICLVEQHITAPLPTGTALIIKGRRNSTIRLTPASPIVATAPFATALTCATADSTLVSAQRSGTHYYTLRTGDQGTGFYHCDSITIPAATAWLPLEATKPSEVRQFISISEK